MSSLVLKSLSILLGVFFIFVGTMKVTSFISKDLHKDLVICCIIIALYLLAASQFILCVSHLKEWLHSLVIGFLRLSRPLSIFTISELLCRGLVGFTPKPTRPRLNIPEIRKEYVKYAKVFPLSELLDFKMPPKWYRRFVGAVEIVCGLAMALVPSNKVKQIANFILLALMLMAVYSHYMVNDKFERIAPALVFFFMLTGRLVIDYQLKRKTPLSSSATGDAHHQTDEKARKYD